MSRILIFMSKMLLNGQGGGVVLDYIRQPCKGQGFFVPFWSVNGCKFPPLWSETENGSQENHKSLLKHFCLKITMFRNSILVRCHQQIWVIFMISWSKFPRGAWPVRSTTQIWIVIRLLLRSFIPSPILVPRAPWGPEYEDQEALGTQDLKS